MPPDVYTITLSDGKIRKFPSPLAAVCWLIKTEMSPEAAQWLKLVGISQIQRECPVQVHDISELVEGKR